MSSNVGASGVRFAGQEDDDDYRSTSYALDGGHDGTKPISVESSVEPNPWMNKDYAIEGIETDLRAGISGSPRLTPDDDSGDIQRGMTTFAYHQIHARRLRPPVDRHPSRHLPSSSSCLATHQRGSGTVEPEPRSVAPTGRCRAWKCSSPVPKHCHAPHA